MSQSNPINHRSDLSRLPGYDITHARLKQMLSALGASFRVDQIGESVEGRSIHRVQWGNGPIPVLMWTQMHGNESTATAAVFDLFDELNTDSAEWVASVRDAVTLHVVPMLNPDGSERYTRRNALNVDLNRDAKQQAMPETQALFRLIDSIQPGFAFNLHDQSTRHTVTGTRQTAIISLMAPPHDEADSISESRRVAMQLIDSFTDILATEVPGRFARYNDPFSPRCVGEQCQMAGIPTILIESGVDSHRYDRQCARELNRMLYRRALTDIANQSYQQRNPDRYLQIPVNDQKMFDILFRRVGLRSERHQVDMGYRFDNEGRGKTPCRLEDVGDLSAYSGLVEHDLSGHVIQSIPDLDRPFEYVTESETKRPQQFRNGQLTDV